MRRLLYAIKKPKFAAIAVIIFLCVLFLLCLRFPERNNGAASPNEASHSASDMPDGLKRVDIDTDAKRKKAAALLDSIPYQPLEKKTFTIAVADGCAFKPEYAAGRYDAMLIERNKMVEDRLGIVINALYSPLELLVDDSYNSYLSGSEYADAMIIPASRLGELAAKGHLLNIYSIPGARFEEEYFNIADMRRLSGGLRSYAILGGLTRDIGSYYCIYVNTALLNAASLPSPCALVRSGEWTWDAFVGYLNGILSQNSEVYPVACNSARELTSCVYKSFGLDYMNTDFDKQPEVGFDIDATDRVVGYLRSLMWSRAYFHNGDNKTAPQAFADGEILFAFDKVSEMEKYSHLGRDWTILPVPKPSADTDYTAYLSPDAPIVVIPQNSRCPESTLQVLRALNAASLEFVDDGYYEHITVTAANNSTTLDMLDYICGIKAGRAMPDLVDLYASQYPELYENTVDTVTELALDPSLARQRAAENSRRGLNYKMSVAFPASGK